MNVRGMRGSADWSFPMPAELAADIDALVDAMRRDDAMLDCCMDQVEGSARMVSEEEDSQIYDYYLRGGWHADVAD